MVNHCWFDGDSNGNSGFIIAATDTAVVVVVVVIVLDNKISIQTQATLEKL